MHERKVQINSFLRDDGLWDLEATLLDVKAYDFVKLSGATHTAGTPVHDMLICVTATEEGEIVEAKVKYGAAPYNSTCFAIESGIISLLLLILFLLCMQGIVLRHALVNII